MLSTLGNWWMVVMLQKACNPVNQRLLVVCFLSGSLCQRMGKTIPTFTNRLQLKYTLILMQNTLRLLKYTHSATINHYTFWRNVKDEELYNGHPFIEEACYQEMPNLKRRLVICCCCFLEILPKNQDTLLTRLKSKNPLRAVSSHQIQCY